MGCRRINLFVVWLAVLLALSSLAPNRVFAQARTFRLGAPDALAETGFLKFLLPRFSLKTGIRIELVDEGEAAEVVLSAAREGKPVFSGLGSTWFLKVPAKDNEHAGRFSDWLTGDVGRRTVDSFKADGKQLFTASLSEDTGEETVVLSGNAAEGEKLAVATG